MELIEIKKRFNEIRTSSACCNLLLAGRNNISCTYNNVDFYSLAFIAYYYGYLERIDNLLKQFGIEEKATCDFKKRLKESWLDIEDDFKRLQSFKSVLSAIIELITTEHLSKNGENILKIAATDASCCLDIESEKLGSRYYTEVKYLGEMRDINQLNLMAIRSGTGVAARSISPPGKIYNYIAWRIADAVGQFNDRNIDFDNRRLFIVFDNHGWEMIKAARVFAWLESQENWFEGEMLNSLIADLEPDSDKKNYFTKPIKDYLSKVGELVISVYTETAELTIYKKLRFS